MSFRQRGWSPVRICVTLTRAAVIMQLLAGKRETQPFDEANGRPLRGQDKGRILKAKMKTDRAIACRGVSLSR
jgi:hypothetical protein